MMYNKLIIVILLCSLSFFSKSQTTPLLSNPLDYQLVFQDEFNGTTMDWNVWDSEDAVTTRSTGETVGRWKENAVLSNGLLKLMFKKGNRPDSEWTAAFIWVKKTYGPNTFYETRFKITNAPGVNNAFWTSCIGSLDNDTRSYKNRYEIDAVEAQKYNVGDSMGAHLAWHDWKTYSYSNSTDIASGYIKNFQKIDFQTWGLWVGEDNFIIYCDGVELWRGTTHSVYTNQWTTGVGKIAVWPTLEEKRAYGKWGQADWNYMGGMNGDDMNICLSNTIMSDAKSTLTSAANNTSMDVDYLRIYKLKSDLNTTPNQLVSSPKLDKIVTILKPINFNVNKNSYFSFVANRPYNSNLSCTLGASSKSLLTLKISKNNELQIVDSVNSVSTSIAYPSNSIANSFFDFGKKYLVVVRITASTPDNDIISVCSFEVGKSIPSREPFLYRNVDADGNSSITNEWFINKKINSTKSLNQLTFADDAQKCLFSDLTFADNYAAVVSKYLNKSSVNIYGESKSSSERRVYFDLQGKFPFTVTYTDGTTRTTVSGITQTPYSFLVTPSSVTEYSLISAIDSAGATSIVGGAAKFYVDDVNYSTVLPSFDTYLTQGTTTNPSTATDLYVSSKPGAVQESFLVFQLPTTQNTTENAAAVVYCTLKSVTAPTKIELLGTTQPVDNTTKWNTLPAANLWEVLDSKVVGSSTGYYLNFDITQFCNTCLANNQRSITLKLRQSVGDESAFTKFKPGNNITTTVPSYIAVKKVIQSALDSNPISNQTILSFNPSSKLLVNISDEIINNVAIYSIDGKLLVEKYELPIDLSEYQSGIFILHIATSTKRFVQKLKL